MVLGSPPPSLVPLASLETVGLAAVHGPGTRPLLA